MFGRGIQPSVAAATLPIAPPRGGGAGSPCPPWPKADSGGGGFPRQSLFPVPNLGPCAELLWAAERGLDGRCAMPGDRFAGRISLSTWLRFGRSGRGEGARRAPQPCCRAGRRAGCLVHSPVRPPSRAKGRAAAPGLAGGTEGARGRAGRGGAGGPAGASPLGKSQG